jgi:glycosyltransferase involved in cell wall biosynthesis
MRAIGNGYPCSILFINHSSQIGGAEISLRELIQALDRRMFKPIVACPPGGQFADEIERSGIVVHRVNIARFKRSGKVSGIARQAVGMPAAARALMAIVREHDVRIVHSNSTHAHVYGALVARLAGIPSVWHVRDSVRLGMTGRILQSLSSKIVVPSRSAVQSVFGGGMEQGKIVVIPNGIDLKKWSSESAALQDSRMGSGGAINIRKEYGIGENEIVIAMVAQLVPWKRQHDFIAAAGLVARKRPDVRFFIIGEDMFGDHRRYAEDLRKTAGDLKLDGRVVFTGRRNDMVDAMASIDVLVLPSLNEPFGRVVIEAMAVKKPVIATNDGGPAEIIEDGVSGFLVPPRLPSALAESMMSLIDDTDRRKRMGSAGRKIAEARFDIRNSAAQVEAIYRNLVGLH